MTRGGVQAGIEWRMLASLSSDTNGMRRSYIRVIVVWLATLLALFALQEYFS
jgi:hypothetical protein